MVDAQFNMFDAAILLIMLLSTLLAFFRGFVREFLSLGAWIGAGMLTMYLFDDVAELIKPHVTSEMVAYLVAGVGTYIGALICFSIFNSIIIRYVKSSEEIGMFDNFLGMLFGLARGAFIVSLGYLVLSLVINNDDPPEWVKEAVTQPYAQKGAIFLANVAPEYLEDISSLGEQLESKMHKQEANDEGSIADGNETFNSDDLLKAGENLFKDRSDTDNGYSEEERKLLEKIMRERK